LPSLWRHTFISIWLLNSTTRGLSARPIVKLWITSLVYVVVLPSL
jgi:hypothetical protein